MSAVNFLQNGTPQNAYEDRLTSSRSHLKQPGDWFSQLPDVILRKIFSYLDPMDFANCAMVNQGWKIAVDFSASASELDLSKIANRSLTDGIVGDLIRASPSLLKLDLSNTFVSDISILQLVMYSRKLSQLSIAYCSNITDIGLSFFKGSKLASIVDYIDLSGCSNVTSCGLIDFVKSMKGAHTWILSDLPQLSNEALRIITSKANLKCFEFRRGKTPKKYPAIEKQVEKCKDEKSEIAKDSSFIDVKSDNLESLSIYGDHTTQSIRLNSDKLTKLAIVNCPHMNHIMLQGITESTTLRCINLSHCYSLTDKSILIILESNYLNSIQELYLAYCCYVTDEAIGPLLQK
ncbi:hypothetical protein ACTXT7_002266 [Hymenolepis weldensis]